MLSINYINGSCTCCNILMLLNVIACISQLFLPSSIIYIYSLCYCNTHVPPILTLCCRIACLLSLQRYNKCLDMINEELESDNGNPDLYVFRAQLNLLFGNVTLHSKNIYIYFIHVPTDIEFTLPLLVYR